MKYNNTVPAKFIRRNNRFIATVLVDGQEEKVHVKNTGRLGELLQPGADVTLQKADQPNRKTAYDLISVYKEGLEWVNIDSLAPNQLMKEYLQKEEFSLVKPEFTYGESRVDFYMERNGEKYLTEVKGCTFADEDEPGCGIFPDAPTTRGVKHLNELAAAAGLGYRCAIAFVIQMNGITRVRPNYATQPEFGEALEAAKAAGVKVEFYHCRVEADTIQIIGKSVE